MTIWLSKNCE